MFELLTDTADPLAQEVVLDDIEVEEQMSASFLLCVPSAGVLEAPINEHAE